MKLKSLVFGAALFSAGVLGSNRIQHAIANLRSNEPLPLVSVRYTNDGTFVNNQQVYENRIGEPRCDWNELAPGDKLQYTLSEMQQNRQVIANYLQNAPAPDLRHFAYANLAQLARREGNSVANQVDSMRTAIGFRYDVLWSNPENPR